jgi:hypothetical protein
MVKPFAVIDLALHSFNVPLVRVETAAFGLFTFSFGLHGSLPAVVGGSYIQQLSRYNKRNTYIGIAVLLLCIKKLDRK